MSRLVIDTGTEGNSATGDTLRGAMVKINTNFEDLYTDLAATTSSGGVLTTQTTNGDVKIVANGTGIVEIDRLSINNTTITSMDTNADITLAPNGTGGVTVQGVFNAGEIVTNEITSNGSNANLKLVTIGTGDLIIDTDGQVGIGSVNAPDTKLHLKSANSVITLQRTADTGSPGIEMQSDGGDVRASMRMDGTGGINKEIVFKVHDGSLAERFRVKRDGATVSGTFAIMSDNDSSLSDATISMTENRITTLRSNDNLELSANGTGEVEMSSSLLVKGSTPFVKIQRTDNANVPGIDFVGQADTSGAKILFDGTSGSANTLIFQTFTVSGGLAEAFRVTGTGAKVTGNLEVTGAQVDFTALPTSDPGVAGRLFRSGNDVKISTG